jgi:hypothetical protein
VADSRVNPQPRAQIWGSLESAPAVDHEFEQHRDGECKVFRLGGAESCTGVDCRSFEKLHVPWAVVAGSRCARILSQLGAPLRPRKSPRKLPRPGR